MSTSTVRAASVPDVKQVGDLLLECTRKIGCYYSKSLIPIAVFVRKKDINSFEFQGEFTDPLFKFASQNSLQFNITFSYWSELGEQFTQK